MQISVNLCARLVASLALMRLVDGISPSTPEDSLKDSAKP